MVSVSVQTTVVSWCLEISTISAFLDGIMYIQLVKGIDMKITSNTPESFIGLK